jgi:hypothetical protein
VAGIVVDFGDSSAIKQRKISAHIGLEKCLQARKVSKLYRNMIMKCV